MKTFPLFFNPNTSPKSKRRFEEGRMRQPHVFKTKRAQYLGHYPKIQNDRPWIRSNSSLNYLISQKTLKPPLSETNSTSSKVHHLLSATGPLDQENLSFTKGGSRRLHCATILLKFLTDLITLQPPDFSDENLVTLEFPAKHQLSPQSQKKAPYLLPKLFPPFGSHTHKRPNFKP